MSKLAQQGFLTIAQNTADVDYLRLAYVQAMSIKLTMPGSQYAVIVDEETLSTVTDSHKKVFDHIITLPQDHAKVDTWKLANEWQVFSLTPFKETIKLESDILFTRSIDHWWTAFRLQDVCLSHGCRTYQQRESFIRKYRQVFDANRLPDVYNGLMYWRYSETSKRFFELARQIFENWADVRAELKNCEDAYPTTDVVYAVAAKIMDTACYNPSLDFVNFVQL
jgi:hypothetical protein